MKHNRLLTIMVLFLAAGFASCKKTEDRKDLFVPVEVDAAPVSDAAPLSGPVKGTMLAGKTYTINGNIIVKKTDTLTIQEGVTLNFTGNFGIGVKGVLLSLGTKSKPNYFTYPGLTRTDQLGADPTKDPALAGKWTGVICDTSCKLLVMKWTHVDFAGGPTTGEIKTSISTKAYPIFFQNPGGIFVLEDSWIYGSVDDPIRTLGGKIAMFRNTFEKCGFTGGEALNAKAGTIGDFAYNVCIGIATNGPKLSNSGAANGVPATNVRIYNNTIINCGFRRAEAGRGGSINFEEGAGGMAFNNIMVNCKYGLRVVKAPIADLANLSYGYNFSYADDVDLVNQFYPPTYLTNASVTDIPQPSTFLPTGWKTGDIYNAPGLVKANDPQFINGPVPLPQGYNLKDVVVVGSYNFGLKPTSPCIGKGYTGFSPEALVPLHPKYGATEITPPGKDMGAYQTNGTGNQH